METETLEAFVLARAGRFWLLLERELGQEALRPFASFKDASFEKICAVVQLHIRPRAGDLPGLLDEAEKEANKRLSADGRMKAEQYLRLFLAACA